jgi:endonuclease YncB( thermonuclease family)
VLVLSGPYQELRQVSMKTTTKLLGSRLCTPLLCCLFAALPGWGAETPTPEATWLELYATVTEVKDGNNLRVLCRRGFVHQVRLSGSDAPEMMQLDGKKARDRLRELVLQKRVRIKHRYFDSRGRLLGKVYVGDICANRQLVSEGLAWFHDLDGDFPELAGVATEARRAKLGLWKYSSPVPPWQWRTGARVARVDRDRDKRPRFPRSQSSNEPKLISR